jgi:hypothetical protein
MPNAQVIDWQYLPTLTVTFNREIDYHEGLIVAQLSTNPILFQIVTSKWFPALAYLVSTIIIIAGLPLMASFITTIYGYVDIAITRLFSRISGYILLTIVIAGARYWLELR